MGGFGTNFDQSTTALAAAPALLAAPDVVTTLRLPLLRQLQLVLPLPLLVLPLGKSQHRGSATEITQCRVRKRKSLYHNGMDYSNVLQKVSTEAHTQT